MKVRTLIADDSVVYRSQIKTALGKIPGIDVVGAASNGRIAIERLLQTPTDLLILDLEMPEMDGLQTLSEMKKRGMECKVLVFSSSSKRGADITMQALALGATDFVAKPGPTDSTHAGIPEEPDAKIRSALEPKVRALFPRGLEPEARVDRAPRVSRPFDWNRFDPGIVVIGSSTGGPTALEAIFSALRPPLSCPIVIAQHMPPVFTAALAERLARVSGIPVTEARHGEVLQKGRVYVAPGDFHLRLEGTEERPIAALDQGPQINWVRPAVDPLFETAAALFGPRCLGIVLTGMGNDGRSGAEAIKTHSGAVVIQNEASCVVFGMPAAVQATGAFDCTGSPEQIAELLLTKIKGGSS